MSGKDGTCYFCTETERIEQHHIVPKRFGGSDDQENFVNVCPTCHSKLEKLYNKRFYDKLRVSKGSNRQHPVCEKCGDRADGQWTNWGVLASTFLCQDCADDCGVSLGVRI